jgi:hypothetical protein
MAFPEKVRIMLFGRSGNRCAFPGCVAPLVFRLTDSAAFVNVGEAAHIVAEQKDGPRGYDELPLADRNQFHNGIVLCSSHHTTIDSSPEEFPIQLLKQWKAQHDATYGSSVDQTKIRDEELYGEYIDQWVSGAHVGTWTGWTQNLLLEGGQSIEEKVFDDIQTICVWLFQRYWPNRYPSLENALTNFRSVWRDLQLVMMKHAVPYGKFMRTEKFYKVYRRVLQRERKLKEYEFHTRLVDDLTLELTRAANLVCDRVRESLDATFRVREGALMVRSGMYENVDYIVHRVEYRAHERLLGSPYPGLQEFMAKRAERDWKFGEGVRPNYLAEEPQSSD